MFFNCKHSLEFTVPYQYTFKVAKLNFAKNIFLICIYMKHAHTPRMKDYIEENILVVIYATRLAKNPESFLLYNFLFVKYI